MKKISLVLIVIMGLMFAYAATDLPKLKDPQSPASTHVTPRYIEKAKEETGSPNLVTAVLADYRGFDTLGETTVIFVGGIAAVMILRGRNKSGGGEEE